MDLIKTLKYFTIYYANSVLRILVEVPLSNREYRPSYNIL